MAQHTSANGPEDDGVPDDNQLLAAGEEAVDELAPGTKLLKGQYTIIRYINSGGFGITYLAKDSLERDVVIKECFPSSFCRRSKTVVAARSRAHSAELRSIVQLFVREARSLAKIVHPNIVAVHQVFEDNGTAYMAIDYINGLDLQQIIEGQGRMPAADEIVLLTEKLLAAVGFIHASDMLHRDISPDNILLDTKGEPILIDFGAAREQASKTNRAMSALRVVKDGYSPQEFYVAGSEQGPWSDLYALGATLYHLISREVPVNGQARLAALAEESPDPFVPLTGRFTGYPDGFLQAIDKAMSTLPKNRMQSAQEWLSMFRPGIELPLTPSDNMAAAVHAMVVNSRIDAVSTGKGGTTSPAAASDPAFGAPPQFARQVSKQPLQSERLEVIDGSDGGKGSAQRPSAPKGGLGMVQIAAGGLVALVIVGIVVTQLGGGADDGPAVVAADAGATAIEAAEGAASDGGSTDTAAVVLPPLGESEQTKATDASDPTVAAAAGQTETAEVAAAAKAIDPADLLQNQIAFAAWDVAMPFLEENRIVGGERVTIVARILPSTDLTSTGSWLAPGLQLYSVNGVDVQQSGSVTTAVLNAMEVDPDGRARVVVEYAGSSPDRQTGLLTVEAQRLVSLANGVRVNIRVIDGAWVAQVTAIMNPSLTQLRQGDILYRDKSTGRAIDTPEVLETVMAALVEAGTVTTEFSIIRDSKIEAATMQLATSE